MAKGKQLTPKTSRGMTKKNLEQKSNANAGLRIPLKERETVPVQFLQDPDDFMEFEIHSWQDGQGWNFVPCAGDGCPLCADEDEKRRKTSYRFVANAYDHAERKVRVLEGGKSLGQLIFFRYETKPERFRKRVYDITAIPTKPRTYDVAPGEVAPVTTRGLKLIDLTEYIRGEMQRYYGEDMPAGTALDAADDDLGDDDEEYSKDELLAMSSSELKAVARSYGVAIRGGRQGVIKAILRAQ